MQCHKFCWNNGKLLLKFAALHHRGVRDWKSNSRLCRKFWRKKMTCRHCFEMMTLKLFSPYFSRVDLRAFWKHFCSHVASTDTHTRTPTKSPWQLARKRDRRFRPITARGRWQYHARKRQTASWKWTKSTMFIITASLQIRSITTSIVDCSRKPVRD